MIVLENSKIDNLSNSLPDDFLTSMIPISAETVSHCVNIITYSRMAGIEQAISSAKDKIKDELVGIINQYGNMPVLMLLQRAQTLTIKAGFYLN